MQTNKKILIITAHPSSKGHTHQIKEVYKTSSEKLGHQVTVLDLYVEGNELPFLKYENIREYEKHPNVARFQQMMTEATEIVVIHPLWWGGAPAILKNFIDQTFLPGFAYKFTKEGKRQKLLKGKTGKVFITTGGPLWIYMLFVIPPFKAIWKYMTLEYCGVKVTDFKVAHGMSLGRRDEHLANFEKRVAKSAGR